jgi:ADP-ribosyl-[dinitrogen reductase] hydrolase
MIDNTGTLQDLISQKLIRLSDSAFLHETPQPLLNFDFSKVEGMLLGVAIGDSLGATTEGKIPEERFYRYGEIKDFLPGKRSNYHPVGVPTDDTQLTFWTLKQLIADYGLIPENLAKRFIKHHIVGIGNTTKEFLRNYKDKGRPWYKSGLDSLGNGALMRIAPITLPYLKNPHQSMFADAALDTMITHNSNINIACCIAFVNLLWQLLSLKNPPRSNWWINTFCGVAEQMENKTSKSLSDYTRGVVTKVLLKNTPIIDACNEWGSGANLFETVPSVIYILPRPDTNQKQH